MQLAPKYRDSVSRARRSPFLPSTLARPVLSAPVFSRRVTHGDASDRRPRDVIPHSTSRPLVCRSRNYQSITRRTPITPRFMDNSAKGTSEATLKIPEEKTRRTFPLSHDGGDARSMDSSCKNFRLSDRVQRQEIIQSLTDSTSDNLRFREFESAEGLTFESLKVTDFEI